MDPNTLLSDMRDLVAQAAQGQDTRSAERQLRWKFAELDEWLSSGGFLPDAWQSGGDES